MLVNHAVECRVVEMTDGEDKGRDREEGNLGNQIKRRARAAGGPISHENTEGRDDGGHVEGVGESLRWKFTRIYKIVILRLMGLPGFCHMSYIAVSCYFTGYSSPCGGRLGRGRPPVLHEVRQQSETSLTFTPITPHSIFQPVLQSVPPAGSLVLPSAAGRLVPTVPTGTHI